MPCWHRSDPHTALTNAALLGPGDVAIGLSHSGRTREVIEVLSEAADHGALTVAVTSFPRSPLAEVADVVMTTAVQETTFRLAALSALHSQLLVLDLIYVAVAQRTYERTTEAFEVTARAVDAHRLPTQAHPNTGGNMTIGAESYLAAVTAAIDQVAKTQGDAVRRAADLVTAALRAGGVVQAFGAGHSEALAMEIAGRAGGLVPTNRIALRDLVLFGGEPTGRCSTTRSWNATRRWPTGSTSSRRSSPTTSS